MTAPRKKRKQPGVAQLCVFLPRAIKDSLQRAAKTESKPQRQVVEDALTAYFNRRPLPEPSPA